MIETLLLTSSGRVTSVLTHYHETLYRVQSQTELQKYKLTTNQVANIRLTDFEINDEEVIFEYDWEFPVIQKADIHETYTTEQVGTY